MNNDANITSLKARAVDIRREYDLVKFIYHEISLLADTH